MNAFQQLIEPIYKDHIHAIRCSLSVDEKTTGQISAKWQKGLFSGHRVSEVAVGMTRNERFTQDWITRRLLRTGMSREQWAVLILRFAPPVNVGNRMVGSKNEVVEMAAAMQVCLAYLPVLVNSEFTEWCLSRWSHRAVAKREKWSEWEGKTDSSVRTLHRRAQELYKLLVSLERSAIEKSREILCKERIIN